MGSVGSGRLFLSRIKKTDLPSQYYYGLGRVGAMLLKSDHENRPSIAVLLWPQSGRIGSVASQIGLVITTSDVTHAIGGSVEHCSAIRASIVMDSLMGMQSRDQGTGYSARGICHGAGEGSGPGGLLGDSSPVGGRERVSTKVRGTESDGGGDGREFPFPPPFTTDMRGRDGGSPGVAELPGGREQTVPTQSQGPYDCQDRRDRPVGLPDTHTQVSGVGAPRGAQENVAF